MHYYGSYSGYSTSSKVPNSKPSNTKTNYSPQVTSHPTVYHPYPTHQKPSSGGCGCGSKLPKR